MKRSQAREIATKITNEQLLFMFTQAKDSITNWNKTSSINKGLTKGTAWNILAKDFKVTEQYHVMAKTNMIREFGEFLPQELKPIKKTNLLITPKHTEPDFSNW